MYRGIVLCLLLSSVLLAQGQSDSISSPPLNNAFLLEVVNYSEVVNLNVFNAATFSLKHHFNPRFGLRASVRFRYWDEQAETTQNSESENIKTQMKHFRKGFGSYFDCFYYFSNQSPVKFYAGLGGGYFFSKTDVEALVQKGEVYTTYGFWGAEWLIKKRLSLSLEYVLAFSYSKIKAKDDLVPQTAFRKIQYTNYELTQKPIKLILSVYF